MARGFRGNRSKLIRMAYGATDRAMANMYKGHKQKKRVYRRLWTVRINAACRALDFKYSWLIDGLTKSGIEINRKWLSDLAITDPEAFKKLVEKARAAR
jgi:large subunit ribosomal protein L20